MVIKPLRKDLVRYITSRNLTKKWGKAMELLDTNYRHPSLHVELLEPKNRRIYSLRLDKKYRALFFITKQKEIEVFQITNHYKK